MKKMLFLMIILSCLKGFSQKSEITPEMSILIDKNLAVFGGVEYKEYRKIEKEFANKIPIEASFSFFKNDFEEWVTVNLSKTNFKSVEEAVELYNRLQATHGKFNDKLSELDEEQNHVIRQYLDEEKFYEIFSKEFEKRNLKRLLASK